jgi:hypothetical protein
MRDAFESWIGQEVVVFLGFGSVKVSLRGVLVRDLNETLAMKLEVGPEIRLAKAKVLAIEEVRRGSATVRRYLFPQNLSAVQSAQIFPGH